MCIRRKAAKFVVMDGELHVLFKKINRVWQVGIIYLHLAAKLPSIVA